jgi:hypothetical protein
MLAYEAPPTSVRAQTRRGWFCFLIFTLGKATTSPPPTVAPRNLNVQWERKKKGPRDVDSDISWAVAYGMVSFSVFLVQFITSLL